jgi:hypothetical protein
MKTILCVAIVLLLFSVNTASAQLPSSPNTSNAWSKGTLDGIRIFYSYKSLEPENFHCRIDYYHDGRIQLLAVEGYYHIPGSPVSAIVVWYQLQPTKTPNFTGSELVTTSCKELTGSKLKSEPTIVAEDMFTKRCVPLLKDLFTKIPVPEVKMFKDQYGSVFGVDKK